MAGKRPVGVAAHVSSVGSSASFFFAMVQSGNVGTSVSQTSCWQMPVQMRRKDLSKTGAPSVALDFERQMRIYNLQFTMIGMLDASFKCKTHEPYLRVYFGVMFLDQKATVGTLCSFE